MRDLDAQRARQASLIVLAGAIVGALLIRLFQHYRAGLEAWIAQDLGPRVKLVTAAMIVLLSAPLLGTAVYLLRRDDDLERRRVYRLVAVFFVAGGVALPVLFWRVVLLLLASRVK